MKTLFAILAALAALSGIAIIIAMAVVDIVIDFDEPEFEDEDEF